MGKFIIMWAVLISLPTIAEQPISLAEAAKERTQYDITYDGSYYQIDYPSGDVASDIGVCTDVIIRSYRKLGIDLQVLVHEDMRDNFAAYPSKRIWGLARTDRNIDHRRVPNLQVFFQRHGVEIPISNDGHNFKPGDIVTWMLPRNLPHIGIVTDEFPADKQRPLIVHNIGVGVVLEDVLFDYPITGHYRFEPK
ncbi:DUF1287 domain-containing protein [Vibrio hyugaensis]|uniref:DUF1287 domain-containing protein n=1 Tax=Vibrio hyugaensis TaxID=1534743 RepID=A0ABQ5XZ22_9VIBR|nr:DUF1287 domain-containing protein [Vibrio hyugaensis]GLR03961.1 DUF1287 domain-containing protein [Vibrio hyugaensis]